MQAARENSGAPEVPILVDTHCHLDVEDFDHDRNAVIERAYALGVRRIVIPGIHAAAWQRVIECRNHWPGALDYALGLHPVYLDRHETSHLSALEHRLARERPIAVGEIGLDYFIRDLDRKRQRQFFVAQLDIAANARLPVLLHVRKAHDEVLHCLLQHRVCGGIVHAYNGSLSQASRYIDLGFKLGFGGMLTFERSTKLRTLAKELPLQSIVLETDAPDLTVVQHRGQRNSPEYLPYCLAAVSTVRDVEAMTVAAQTTANANSVLGPHRQP